MTLTIRARLTIWYSLVTLLTLVAAALVLSAVHRRLGLNRIDRGLDDNLVTVRIGIDHELDEGLDLRHAVGDALSELELPGTGVAILDAQGALARRARLRRGDAAGEHAPAGERRGALRSGRRGSGAHTRGGPRAGRLSTAGRRLDVAGAFRCRTGDGEADVVGRHARGAAARGRRWLGHWLASARATLQHGAAGQRDRRSTARRPAHRAGHGRRAGRPGDSVQQPARSPGRRIPCAAPVHGGRLASAAGRRCRLPGRRRRSRSRRTNEPSRSIASRSAPSPARPSALPAWWTTCSSWRSRTSTHARCSSRRCISTRLSTSACRRRAFWRTIARSA